MTKIHEPVGDGRKNGASDVKYVQALLVDWQLVRRRKPLTIDGNCGPLTKAAILEFQHAEGLAPDGCVEPGGLTIERLEDCHMTNLLGPLAGVAHYALISPKRRPLQPCVDANKPIDRYLSALRGSFDQKR